MPPSSSWPRWSAATTAAVLLLSIVVTLIASALVAAFLLHPPLLGWAGFATVFAIALSLTASATAGFGLIRVNPQQAAVSPDGAPRLLVVADEHCGSPALWQAIYARLADAAAVHVVVPVRVSHLHYLTNDEDEESDDAERRVRLVVRLLRQRGVVVTGEVGSDDPLEAMTDALGSFAATRVLLATSAEQKPYWLERELLARAKKLTPLRIDQIVVPPTPAAKSSRDSRTAAPHSPQPLTAGRKEQRT